MAEEVQEGYLPDALDRPDVAVDEVEQCAVPGGLRAASEAS